MNSRLLLTGCTQFSRSILFSICAAAIALAALSAPVGAAGPSGQRTSAGTGHRAPSASSGVTHHQIDWQQHDRAVYAVTTLNAPLCDNGQQLSTVLWTRDGARVFDVLGSKQNPNLYYVVAHKADRTTLGVYAYEFGWKLPKGVRSSECVNPAPADVVAGFQRGQLVRVGRFKTTFPQS